MSTRGVDARETQARPSRRLLIVMPVFLPESHGGAERQCAILAPELVRLGWQVTILTPTMSRSLAKTESAFGARVRRLYCAQPPSDGGRHLPSFLSWSARAFGWIAAHRDRIDAIYVFHGRLHAAPAAVAALLFGKPLYVKLGRGGQTFDFNSLRTKRFLYGKAVAHLLKRATTAFVANSGEIVSNLRAEGIEPGRIHLIPNGVELPENRGGEARDRPRRGVRLLYAGRLAPEKNIDRLIEAFARIAAKRQDVELLVAGDGPLRPELEALVAGLGEAGERVRFLGHIDRLAELYRGADFFVSASDAEGQSNALLEAMAHGLVPVACLTSSGANDLIVAGETGFLARSSAAADFAVTLDAALAIDAIRRSAMADANVRKIRELYSIEAIALRLDCLLSRKSMEFQG